jgi:NADPH2:quinone reductase
VFWGNYVAREPAGFGRDMGALFELIAQGRLKPHISARYPLARGAAALDDMMNRKVIGKVVITN